MTRDEAKKVIEAISEGCGFADQDVEGKISLQLIHLLPEVPWEEIYAEINAQEIK